MKRKQQMSKNTRQTENIASGSPYVNRCGEYAETDAPAPKPEKKSNIGVILVIFVLAGAAGAAYYYIKFVKGKKPKDEDMDFFDDEGYEEEPYINEDEEPQIAEDAETDGDEN